MTTKKGNLIVEQIRIIAIHANVLRMETARLDKLLEELSAHIEFVQTEITNLDANDGVLRLSPEYRNHPTA